MCYCSFCKILFNGSGGNLRSHSTSHSPTQYTQQQKDTAFIMFLVRRYVGLTCLRDPITDIFYPGLTFSRAMSLIEVCTNQVKESVIEELDGQSVCLMIDGWTDQSLRRFLGIVASYFQQDRNRTVYRALALHWGEGRDHRAATQIEAIKSTLSEYNILSRNCSCLCADSASVNTAIAQEMDLTWCPCFVHQWNLIVRRFIDNSPASFRDLLSRISALRKKTKWVEFLVTKSSRRNIAGYTPTRWCSVVECIESFYQHFDLIIEFSGGQGKDMSLRFHESDRALVESIRNVLLRFAEANQMLIEADEREGLATVFETVNAIYLMLLAKQVQAGSFDGAINGAIQDIELRFFFNGAKSSCRVMFAGILNVKHAMPTWLTDRLEVLGPLLVEEVQLFTGASPPGSPREPEFHRYNDAQPLSEMIEHSDPITGDASIAFEEVREFLAVRSSLNKETYTRFWSGFARLRHLQAVALMLRGIPTNTTWIERSFSKARRILSWSRMRLSPQNANCLWLLSCNGEVAERILGTCQQIDESEDPNPEDDVILDEDIS